MKIKLTLDQNIFFTSDTHYNHSNICKATTEWKNADDVVRDFNSLSHMNDTIVNNINSVVGENDVLVHLGDWSFGGVEQIWNFRKRILCKNIHLFLGNHDHHIENNVVLPNCHWSPDGSHTIIDGQFGNRYGDQRDDLFSVEARDLFTSVSTYGELDIRRPTRGAITKEDKKKNDKYYFTVMHYPLASWNHMNRGHIHLHGHVHLHKQHKMGEGRHLDVGVDGNDFKPYKLETIYNLVGNKPISKLTLPKDHHVKRVK